METKGGDRTTYRKGGTEALRMGGKGTLSRSHRNPLEIKQIGDQRWKNRRVVGERRHMEDLNALKKVTGTNKGGERGGKRQGKNTTPPYLGEGGGRK